MDFYNGRRVTFHHMKGFVCVLAIAALTAIAALVAGDEHNASTSMEHAAEHEPEGHEEVEEDHARHGDVEYEGHADEIYGDGHEEDGDHRDEEHGHGPEEDNDHEDEKHGRAPEHEPVDEQVFPRHGSPYPVANTFLGRKHENWYFKPSSQNILTSSNESRGR